MKQKVNVVRLDKQADKKMVRVTSPTRKNKLR
jgi:hypothetical protein